MVRYLSIGKKQMKVDSIFDFLLFCGPALILFTLFFTYPLFQGILYSFTDWDGIGAIHYIGLSNYTSLLQDVNFKDSLMRTFYIAAINVFLVNVLAMLFALALTTHFKLNTLIRAVIFLPTMISMVIAGFIWKFMFTQISRTIYQVTGIGMFNQSWLGDGDIVLRAVIIVSVWHGLGVIMTIYIAGLMGVNESVIEAAKIDGANFWSLFFKIKLPLMLPIVAVGAFLNLSGSLKMFDTIFSLTGGGPGNASEVAMLNVYREAFIYRNFGYGSAKAVVLALIIVVVTVLQLRLTSGKEVHS